MKTAADSQTRPVCLTAPDQSTDLSSPTVGTSLSVVESQGYVTDEIIIKFKSDIGAGLQNFFASTMQSSLQATVTASTQALGSQLWKIQGLSVAEAIATYQDHPSIEYIQPNYQLRLATLAPAEQPAAMPNDPGMPDLWGLDNTGQTGGLTDADIDAPEAWDLSQGENVVVGVIDTGVDYTHPDLDGNLWTNPGEIAGNGLDDDGNGYIDDYIGYDFIHGDADPYDDNGHGTHVAGTIAAAANNGIGVTGVAPQAKIMALKIFDANGYTDAFSAIQAIEYATMMGADITNNSWGGGGYSQALYDAIAAAQQAGQVFVAAAGNGGFDGIGDNNDWWPNYPANYDVDNIIAVAASDHADYLAFFSNYGANTVDLSAPGVNIVSTVPGGYDTFSGTSMATPHVAGAAALLLAQDPTLTPQAVRQILLDATDAIAAQAGATVSGGRLNAYTALLSLQDSFGEIRGQVWQDQDGDGVWDWGETALSGWTVYLDQNDNGQLDSGEQVTLTDANGNYGFGGLAAGEYTIAQVVPQDWQQTAPAGATPAHLGQPQALLLPQLSTTGSSVPMQPYGEVVPLESTGTVAPLTDVSGPLINLDDFRQDVRFAGIDGSGYATVVLDTGIDLDHSFFGPDSNGDGVSDRIVYQYDFADGDADASDINGHGSNVTSIVASSDDTYTGMAPGADIIHLKVFGDNGGGSFASVEAALQWVVENATDYNIASVNLSLGDTANWNMAQSQYGLGDELAALAALDVMVVSASGNDFYSFNSQQGVSYPAVDPNSLSVGATFDRNMGSATWSSGATAYASGTDHIAPFSQRHDTLTSIFAPGAPITGAGPNGDLVTMTGTSQAAPHIAGIAVLAQHLAQQTLGRRLSLPEFGDLLVSSGVTIHDGDDESDNVTNTGLDFKRVDVFALGEAILALGSTPGAGSVHQVSLDPGEIVTGLNFGNRPVGGPPEAPKDNLSFEMGDFSGWQTQGDTTLQTSDMGVNPTDGSYQALLTTDGYNGAIAASDLEAFLGLEAKTLNGLGNGFAIAGSALKLTDVEVNAGDVLTFDWNFLTTEDTPTPRYNDFGFVALSNGFEAELADTFGSFTPVATADFDQYTGYGTYRYTFTTDGTYTLGIGVADAGDNLGLSGLLLDNVQIAPAAAPPLNLGFESGDFTNWQTQGDTQIQTTEVGVAPREGTYHALVTTGDGAVTDTQLEDFLGLERGTLDRLGNGDVVEGSVLQLEPIYVKSGDILTVDWDFLTNEDSQSPVYNDFGFMVVDTGLTAELADTYSPLASLTSEHFEQQTGYTTVAYEFTETGWVFLAFGIAGVTDGSVDSGLLLDNLILHSGRNAALVEAPPFP